jgi:hypothetical protein
MKAAAGDFASHLWYSAIEAPVSGFDQMVNKALGTDLPVAKRPESASVFGTAGDLAGSVLDFLVLSRLVKGGLVAGAADAAGKRGRRADRRDHRAVATSRGR